jgi:uncharacterized protein
MSRSWLLALLLLPLVVLGWTRLRLETDILATLPQELEEVGALRQLRDGFSGGSDLVIAFEAPDAEKAGRFAESAVAVLAKRKDLVKEVRRSEDLASDGGTGSALVAWALQNAAPSDLTKLRQSLEGDAAARKLSASLEAVATSVDMAQGQRAAYDPLGLLEPLGEALESLEGAAFGLESEDGTFRVLMVTPATPVGNYRAAEAWLSEVRKLLPVDPEVSVRFTGEPAFQAEIGAGIEKDMSSTVGLTEVLIALLFWFMFGRLKPMIWIQVLLVLCMFITLGLGGLLVGKLSIMSLAFAAIVLGIVVDYAVLIIQEARLEPSADASALRKKSAPGILAGGLTTAVVFLSLVFSRLPGLAELGALVALGVLVGLGVMLWLVPSFAAKRQQPLVLPVRLPNGATSGQAGVKLATGALLVGCVLTFWLSGIPKLETGAEALRPTHSQAMDTLQWMQKRLGRDHEISVPMLVEASPDKLRAAVQRTAKALTTATKKNVIQRYTLPAILVADPEAQQTNREFVTWLVAEVPRLEVEAAKVGFSPAATALLRGVAEVWSAELKKRWPILPRDAAAASVLGRFLHSEAVTGAVSVRKADELERVKVALSAVPEAKLAGWETLGSALASLVRADLVRQLLPILALLLVTLLITFRTLGDVLLSVAALAVGMACLAASMALIGWAWNLASLAAIPLLLGTGLDYGIHILLAMKRNHNDVVFVRATTGKAVLFSGLTTVIAFGSLCFTSNRGIASLGLTCAVGTLWILAVVVGFLPFWRAWAMRIKDGNDS